MVDKKHYINTIKFFILKTFQNTLGMTEESNWKVLDSHLEEIQWKPGFGFSAGSSAFPRW